ncbi:MAG: hypothetical protein A2Y70_02010 [Candidatus Aminicenantes bacterium RBG_13_64_14]|nr:MAG: hypothetical protein A2Y70_02010 [Candidatus Aminicenantes bacterium RBG_13_64_14]
MNIARWFRVRRLRAKVRGAKACLRWVDKQMARLGCPVWKRQQMRRDIVTSDEAWIDCLDLLSGEKAKALTPRQMRGSKRVIRAALETVEEKR